MATESEKWTLPPAPPAPYLELDEERGEEGMNPTIEEEEEEEVEEGEEEEEGNDDDDDEDGSCSRLNVCIMKV